MPTVHVYILVTGLLIALGIMCLYVLPNLLGWNSGESWGYSVSHALTAGFAMVGWGVILLAFIGAILMVVEGGKQNLFWVLCACAWLGLTVLLPTVVTYQPAYSFAFALPVLVLAGTAISTIYSIVRKKSGALAVACLLALSLMSLPSLVSHYQDGSRAPMRDGAEFIAENWMPGDAVSGFSMGTFRYYAKGCCGVTIPLARGDIAKLRSIAAAGQPTWLILESGRSGLGVEYESWLFACTTHRAHIRKRRFDEQDFVVAIFKLDRVALDCQ